MRKASPGLVAMHAGLGCASRCALAMVASRGREESSMYVDFYVLLDHFISGGGELEAEMDRKREKNVCDFE